MSASGKLAELSAAVDLAVRRLAELKKDNAGLERQLAAAKKAKAASAKSASAKSTGGQAAARSAELQTRLEGLDADLGEALGE